MATKISSLSRIGAGECSRHIIGEGLSGNEDIQLKLRLEPYAGRTQAVLEWQPRVLPPKEVRQGILSGIKRGARSGNFWRPGDRAPIINFRVVITDCVFNQVDGIEYEAVTEAYYAFENALKHVPLIPTAQPERRNIWETSEADTNGRTEFEIVATATSTISSTARAWAKYIKVPGRYAVVDLALEPNQGNKDFFCTCDLPSDQIPEELIQASFDGVKTAALAERAGHGVLVNIKAILTDARVYPTDASEMSFAIAAKMAFEQALSQTTIINLPR